jgi:hypothetical protein
MADNHKSPLRPEGEDLLQVSYFQRPCTSFLNISFGSFPGSPLRPVLRPQPLPRLSLPARKPRSTARDSASRAIIRRSALSRSDDSDVARVLRLARAVRSLESGVRVAGRRVAPAKRDCACTRRGRACAMGGAQGERTAAATAAGFTSRRRRATATRYAYQHERLGGRLAEQHGRVRLDTRTTATATSTRGVLRTGNVVSARFPSLSAGSVNHKNETTQSPPSSADAQAAPRPPAPAPAAARTAADPTGSPTWENVPSSPTSSFPSMSFPEPSRPHSPEHTHAPRAAAPAPPPVAAASATLAVFDDTLPKGTRFWALITSLSVNMLLPFVNGVMLGFGEIFAKTVVVGWLGWGPAVATNVGLGASSASSSRRRRWWWQ